MNITKLTAFNNLSNTFIIEKNNTVIIIDCGANLQQINKVIGKKKVTAVFITHAHYDHIFYLDDYIKTFNCDVYCTKNGFEKFKNPNKNLSALLNEEIVINANNFIEVTNNLELEINSLNIKCLILTGHSNCSAGYIIENNLFCGDVLFQFGVGRTDFYDGSACELRQSLRTIKKLSPINIHCGHGESFSI